MGEIDSPKTLSTHLSREVGVCDSVSDDISHDDPGFIETLWGQFPIAAPSVRRGHPALVSRNELQGYLDIFIRGE